MWRPAIKRTIERLVPFSVIWLLSCWVFLFVELTATNSLNELPVTAIKVDFSIFIFASTTVMGVGALMGLIELKYLDLFFVSKSFGLRLLAKLFIYYLAIFLIILILFPLAASLELNTSILDRQVWVKYFTYLGSYTYLSTVLQLTVSLMLSLFYSEISDFIGQRIFLNFFTGKYYQPVEEERIFMFADMKSSTTIAESMGHVEYFKLLSAYYRCFTDAIIESGGEIYQYVGDEIILSWKLRHDTSDNQPLECFFAMKKSLSEKRSWFNAQFGFAPVFKAAIHLGKVTTGEIGVIKKEILFTGDVLNATARIQSLCNDYETNLIVSDRFRRQVAARSHYVFSFLDQAHLRGKKYKIDLFTVNDHTNLISPSSRPSYRSDFS